eukprot:CAMPEP_0194522848 /NCGR_PEP_ID=MMETSP0253-20130528/57570_1 /TAXON_ID=2966 /ORGANISM="Noctiluca scintillans" /LENGTH=49 /DNA_ID=CAMNT_0039367327 /DNA_START=24 /DNA_END=173 /DNA_ORIENTATION=+
MHSCAHRRKALSDWTCVLAMRPLPLSKAATSLLVPRLHEGLMIRRQSHE